jgi:hypothetical protein
MTIKMSVAALLITVAIPSHAQVPPPPSLSG